MAKFELEVPNLSLTENLKQKISQKLDRLEQPTHNLDMADAIVYALDAMGHCRRLGKVDWYSTSWDYPTDAYKMKFEIKGDYNIARRNAMDEIYQKFMSQPKSTTFIPKKIIQNGPAFIVFWDDGTKTILKKKAEDLDDPYAAFGQALMIKIFGTNSMAHKIVDRRYEKQERMTKEEFKTLKEAIDNIAFTVDRWRINTPVLKNLFGVQSPSEVMRGEEDESVEESKEEDQNGGD